MKPIDYRNITWEGIQNHIHNDREAVLHALREHGPCTTRSLSNLMKMDILTVRPRVTELLQLGFVEVWEPDFQQGRTLPACTAGHPAPQSSFSGTPQGCGMSHTLEACAPSKREGIYRALSDEEAFEAFRQRKFSPNYQPQLL